MHSTPNPYRRGELGLTTAHGTTHGDRMVSVDFQTKGTLEILAERTFIHPLEATANWAPTGPQFVLGERITTLAIPPTLGVVHGFITPPNGSLLVLIWFNERQLTSPNLVE